LVSFDGFRYDYAERYNLPNFKRMMREGASAESMTPSFPSKTFPNHYTLVTGLYPGNHGLVDNDFYDPIQKKQYAIKNRIMVEDTSFYGGTPLWQLAQEQGLKSASFFWVGSETKIRGQYPNYYRFYDAQLKDADRVAQTLAWLELPEAERPNFISLYFSLVDTEGHASGYQSEKLKQTVQKADSLLGMLLDGIKKIDLPINTIVVSDHGMLEMKREDRVFVYVSKLIDVNNKSVVFANAGSQAHFYTKNVDSLYAVLKNQEKNFRVYKQHEFPQRWHYQHKRSGDILIVAEPGSYILTAARNFGSWLGTGYFGEHGYDPYVVNDVGAIFYAIGPNIKKGVRLKPFENIHVYPFIAKILALKTPLIDGDVRVLENAYKR
jgi:predicted AlkP superfamily pyrophosphatase or phosphodiesterase